MLLSETPLKVSHYPSYQTTTTSTLTSKTSSRPVAMSSKHFQTQLNNGKRSNNTRRKPLSKDNTTRGPFNMKLWFKSVAEIVSTSLFFSPVLGVFFAIGLGLLCNYIDSLVAENRLDDPPVIWTTTVSSAQTLLSTVAGATISFAGTAFSVSLLVIQLTSTSYSPRVVHTLFKDPFNRRIVTLVVSTFTYCLVIMRSLGDSSSSGQSPNEDGGGKQVIPNISVAVAFILGIMSVLAIVAFIDHAANTMDVSQLLERITRDTVFHIQRTWELEDSNEKSNSQNEFTESENKNNGSVEEGSADVSSEGDSEKVEENPKKPEAKKGEEAEAESAVDSHVVRFRTSGWVQEVDSSMLKDLVPEAGSIKVHTLEGRYAIPGTAICSVRPKPTIHNLTSMSQYSFEEFYGDEDAFLEMYDTMVVDAFMIGNSRTMRCDASYGLRQIVDIVLRALSPGVNDPTTAQDGIFHFTAIVTEFLHRKLPASEFTNKSGGRLILSEQQDYDSIVRLAFDEVRIYAASSPTVALYLLESLRLIRESLVAGGLPGRAPEIERQAHLIEEGVCHNKGNINDDHEMIVKAKQDRFESNMTPGPKKSTILPW